MRAVIVVDLQKGLKNSFNEHIFNEEINDYIKNEEFDMVVYTRYFNHEDSAHYKFLNYKKMLEADDIEIAVEMLPDCYVFPKDGYGLQTEQIKFLKEKGVEEVVLCGTDVDACVLAIAFNLFDAGIKVKFKWNLCATHNSDVAAKLNSKLLLERNFGDDCII